ncbi:MAG: DUF2254 domain-containing protein [Ginsengibacter sp.]
MLNNLRIWIAKRYQKIINSIAFYPALIAFSFLILSYLFIAFDFSDAGKQIKSQLHWLSLKDASTARSIISSIAGGIISLTVFSFSMVMIILNQTASQMSNRILDKLIGNRFQQIVLGVYIGTIVFALFLLSTIRDLDSGISVPALSTYLLILLTIVDIFLFIYFLHFITQSVKYEVIIRRIYSETKSKMKNHCPLKEEGKKDALPANEFFANANSSGVYEGFNKSTLLQLCSKNDCVLHVLKPPGTFVYSNTPLVRISKKIKDEAATEIANSLYIHDNESIDNNFFYGFRQLMEVAIKALSPGINDPGTAVQCLRALSKLFIFRMNNFPAGQVKDKEGRARIIVEEITPGDMFSICFLPIWKYGKDDLMIQSELLQILTHLRLFTNIPTVNKLYNQVAFAIKNEELHYSSL